MNQALLSRWVSRVSLLLVIATGSICWGCFAANTEAREGEAGGPPKPALPQENPEKAMLSAPLPIQRVSPRGELAVHFYFHTSPESPDGTRVVYTLFPKETTEPFLARGREFVAPAEVYICDRDGNNRRLVGTVRRASTHVGARAIWLDNDTVAFHDREDFTVHIVSVGKQPTASRIFTGNIADYSSERGEILFAADGPFPISRKGTFYSSHINATQLRKAIYALNVKTGALRVLVPIEALKRFAPLGGRAYSPAEWLFEHPHWSPDSSKISFLVQKAPYSDAGSNHRFLFTCQAEGFQSPEFSIVSFGSKPMHEQFWDSTSFFGHDDVTVNDQKMKRWSLNGRLLETVAGRGNHGTVSPDRKWIVTDSWYHTNPTQLFLYRKGQTVPERILAEQKETWKWQLHMHPAWSNDGKRVYFNWHPPDGALSEVACINLDSVVHSDAEFSPRMP